MSIYRPGRAFKIIAPNPVKQLLSAEYLAGITRFPLVKDMNPLYQSTFPINR